MVIKGGGRVDPEAQLNRAVRDGRSILLVECYTESSNIRNRSVEIFANR